MLHCIYSIWPCKSIDYPYALILVLTFDFPHAIQRPGLQDIRELYCLASPSKYKINITIDDRGFNN